MSTECSHVTGGDAPAGIYARLQGHGSSDQCQMIVLQVPGGQCDAAPGRRGDRAHHFPPAGRLGRSGTEQRPRPVSPKKHILAVVRERRQRRQCHGVWQLCMTSTSFIKLIRVLTYSIFECNLVFNFILQ